MGKKCPPQCLQCASKDRGNEYVLITAPCMALSIVLRFGTCPRVHRLRIIEIYHRGTWAPIEIPLLSFSSTTQII